ncbi:unnamed protein product, partial [marine sediment metagenome]
MSIKYLGDQSEGQAFGTKETKNVVVTEEALDKSSGYEGDTIVYTATVKDDLGVALPATFVADLLINGTDLKSDQVLDAAVYDPITFLLTLSWQVPAAVGNFNVKLSWDEQ